MEKNETLVKKPTFDETRVKIVLVGDKEVGKTSFLIRYLIKICSFNKK